MKFLIYPLLLLLSCLISCDKTSKNKPNFQGNTISTDSTIFINHPEFNGVLFTKNFIVGCLGNNQTNCINVLEFTLGQKPITFWKADLQTIYQLEKKFKQHFQDTKGKLERYEEGNIPYDSLGIPLRQYVGYKDSLGTKYIWVNLFPPSFSDLPTPDSNKYEIPRWRRLPITIEDGGPQIFNFDYKVETGELLNFYYNNDG